MSKQPKVKDLNVTVPQPRKTPLWKGPDTDGVTQSLLARFLVCRERFRLHVVEGLHPTPTFNHRIEYGSMWHVCEKFYAKYGSRGFRWTDPLREYCKGLVKKYPTQVTQINHWMRVCLCQFPVYVDKWAPYKEDFKPVYQEYAFRVPYCLPSGRVVLMRGQWDSVFANDKCWTLWENKTKGDVNEELIHRQLGFDLQTMFYATALKHHLKVKNEKGTVRKLRYNVVRRPLSGGKHSISMLQNVNRGKKGINGKPLPARPESEDEYYSRLHALIREDPEWYFTRFNVDLLKNDFTVFEEQFLIPIFEQLCDWWEYITHCLVNGSNPFTVPTDGFSLHWRTPYGFYNVLAEGGITDVDAYLTTGSESGLTRTDTLFPELEPTNA